jgi:exopolysaccharide biosynthesis polyprenyl glycosylphosphotransferase
MNDFAAKIDFPLGGQQAENRPLFPKGDRHRALLMLVDLLCLTWTAAIADLIRFGLDDSALDVGHFQTPYALVTVVLDLVWWAALGFFGARDPRVLGYGQEEYKRVTTASLWLFGAIAVFSYIFQLETARGYVVVSLSLGIGGLLLGRCILRIALVQERQSGTGLRRVLLIGGSDSVAHLSQQLGNHPEAGYRPVAVHLTNADKVKPRRNGIELPLVGVSTDIDSILTAVEASRAEIVAVSSGAALGPNILRQLGWALSARDIGLVVAPALTDIAGPRIHMQPVAGLPLIHVTTPKLDGIKGVAKRGFDIASSLVLLTILGVPMLLVAVWVKIDSPGQVIFRQTRIGRAGDSFQVLKFRSMVADAESRLHRLNGSNQGSGPLFKLKKDPRVTRFGRFIRRYSIDELPQLVNVLNGTMSLVGPRPPLPSEVEKYDPFEHRRLLVKPGLTGLWQVSGRSDLSWDDSIRLDLYYVENWSMIQDVIIILRTARAVVSKTGAY